MNKKRSIQLVKYKNEYIAIDKETREEIEGLIQVETNKIIDSGVIVAAKLMFILTDPKDIIEEIIIDTTLEYVE